MRQKHHATALFTCIEHKKTLCLGLGSGCLQSVCSCCLALDCGDCAFDVVFRLIFVTFLLAYLDLVVNKPDSKDKQEDNLRKKKCGKTLCVKAESAGKKGRCPACQQIIEIPRADEDQPVPPAAPVSRDMEESINTDNVETAAFHAKSGAVISTRKTGTKLLKGLLLFGALFLLVFAATIGGLMLYNALREHFLSPSPLGGASSLKELGFDDRSIPLESLIDATFAGRILYAENLKLAEILA